MSRTVTTAADAQDETLGSPVPPFTAHAISVSLPKWRDNVAYEEGDRRVADVMVSGYPRFFIHLDIQKLAKICERKFGVNGERCLLCPTQRIAEECRKYMIDRSTKTNGSPMPVRLVQFLICPENEADQSISLELHIVLFPGDQFSLAKQFFQHTGLCISSRYATRCLSILENQGNEPPSRPTFTRPTFKKPNRHYSSSCYGRSPPASPNPVQRKEEDSLPSKIVEELSADQSVYVEERYGRNLPIGAASAAKRALRRRIAGVLVRDTPSDWSTAGGNDAQLGPSTRGVENVTEDHVFLYSTGMSAIWSAHQLALAVLPPAKSVCFGFPYADTVKCLEKWGPGCIFLGHGLDSDIDELAQILDREVANGTNPPALALFTEFPSNPLLRCADLPRLRALADKYDFLMVVDETIGNFMNVEVLPYADIVVSSLTKIFSGDANVMGGSLVLNPHGRHYAALKEHMARTFEDSYFDEDAIYMERNSRDFKRRIGIVDDNALAVCTYLHSRSVAASSPPPNCAVKEVFYPRFTTAENYDQCRLRKDGQTTGGYGGLFSVTFTSMEASRAFFDSLPCYKGPSLGTNFTLACPYTVIAHFLELEWAARYGVEEGLVRVSVGMEDREELLKKFEIAVLAAEAAVQNAQSA